MCEMSSNKLKMKRAFSKGKPSCLLMRFIGSINLSRYINFLVPFGHCEHYSEYKVCEITLKSIQHYANVRTVVIINFLCILRYGLSAHPL